MSKSDSRSVEGKVAFPCERDTDAFANKISSELQVPLVIWLEGDLGAGKTTFARSLIQALGHKGRVKSPTYGLLEQYLVGSLQVIHMDLYRISEPGELEFLGLEDMLDEKSILLVEWPDRGGLWLPRPDLRFEFHYASEGRDLHWKACTLKAKAMMSGFLGT